MSFTDSESVPPGRYNRWCHRAPLVCDDKDLVERSVQAVASSELTPTEQAALFLHKLAGCTGLEFVAFSNARLPTGVVLADDITIVPCFMPTIRGQDMKNPLVEATWKMQRQSRFVYDGWVPIASWDAVGIRSAIRRLDEELSLFCLSSRSYFQWEPKYKVAPTEVGLSYEYDGGHLEALSRVSQAVTCLNEPDRVAVFRSLGWLSQSLRLDEAAARFLFPILAIESLAMHIEEQEDDESPLSALRAECPERVERRQRREKCISETLSRLGAKNLTLAVQEAYLTCVYGLKERLKQHLAHVFGPNTEPIALLFEPLAGDKSLYDLRHSVAHGTLDALSEVEREAIRKHLWDAERLARRYVLTVLEQALQIAPLARPVQASGFFPVQEMIVVSKKTALSDNGTPAHTHMALLYSS